MADFYIQMELLFLRRSVGCIEKQPQGFLHRKRYFGLRIAVAIGWLLQYIGRVK